jgi:CubicO group peptidase (beta-lactamase class C family)
MLLLLILVGCNPLQKNSNTEISQNEYLYHKPEKIDDGWQTSSLIEQNIAPDPIVEMINKIKKGEFTGINSVILARGGVLVLEEYFGEYQRESLHNMRSASKAITSALVGIAIDHNFIATVNEPLLPYFPEYDGKIKNWDERKRDITIAHLLSMSSGVKGNENEMYPTDDWIKFFLDQPLAHTPGEVFSYATSGVVTLGNVITRASGLRIPAFTDRFLFGPLDITKYRWPGTSSLGGQGLAMTGGGLNLQPRDMMKFGQLFLNDGEWDGKQIISKEWITESTTKKYPDKDYGYIWKMKDRKVADSTIHSFEAWGNGGQFILVFPSLDFIAVFTGENYGLFPEMEQPFIMIDKFILPAIK